MIDELTSEQAPPDTRPHDSLSDREYQIMRMIASGLTILRSRHGCSQNEDDHTFRMRALKKMKMKTTAELMHYAISHGLVD